ncbi:MAG: DDE-type integrase/transposase/recombinase [Bacteroidota bacterium]
MPEWIAAREAAELLGVGVRAVQMRAKRGDWQAREIPHPSGGPSALQYHVSHLPEAARIELARRQVARIEARDAEAALARQAREAIEAGRRERAAAELASLTETEAETVTARVELLRAVSAFQSTSGLTAGKARAAFATMYADGKVAIELHEELGDVSARTLARWQKALTKDGPAALAPSYGRRSTRAYGRAITEDNELGRYVLGKLYEKGRLVSAELLREGALALYAAGELESKVPSVRTFNRHLAWLEAERPQVWAHLVTPHSARGTVMPAFGSMSEQLERPNQKWELDSTLADILLEVTHERTGETTRERHHLIACVDVYTRRVKFLVSRRSRSVAIAGLLRACLLDWGVPEMVKMDNGKDYTSRHIELVLEALEVRRELCPPFTPWHKPHVERAIGSFQRSWLALADGYVGPSVAERKAVEARKTSTAAGEAPMLIGEVPLSPLELQGLCDDWTDRKYLHAEHSETHQTPFDLARGHRVRRIEDARALDILLARQVGGRNGLVKVGKKGIRYTPNALKGAGRPFYFVAPELVTGDFVGRQVLCFEDAADVGRLYVFTTGTPRTFVAVAECPQLAGTSLAEAAQVARVAYTEKKREIMKAGKKAATRHSAATTLEHIRSQARGDAKVAGAIGPVEIHETDGLAAAADAAEAMRQRALPSGPVEATDEERAAHEAMLAEAEAERQRAVEAERQEARLYELSQAKTTRLYASDDEKYLALLDRRDAGDPLSPDEQDWLTAYQSPDWTGTAGR